MFNRTEREFTQTTTRRGGPETKTYKAEVLEFLSVGHFAETMGAHKYTQSKHHEGTRSGTSWTNDESFEESRKLALVGREDWAQKAKDVYDLLETGGIELEIHQWGADRCGAFPIVPDYLAGIPENMRRRLTNQSDMAPVAIYADISASAAFGSSDLCKRGAAVLALTMALQQHRPVSLYLVSGLSKSYNTEQLESAAFTVMKCDTIPMDLSQLAYLFGSAGFFRNLIFSFGEREFGFSGNWPWNLHETGTPANTERCKAILRLEPQDLYIPGIHAEDESVQNPLAWVQSHLEHYAQHIED